MSTKFGDAAGFGLIIAGLMFAAGMFFNLALFINRRASVQPVPIALFALACGIAAMVWQYFYGLAW